MSVWVWTSLLNKTIIFYCIFSKIKNNYYVLMENIIKMENDSLSVSLITRSSHQYCYIKKLFLKNAQYSHKNTFVGVSFHKACSFIKNKLQHGCFPVNIVKFLRTHFLKNICERLLLNNKIFPQ